MVKVRSRSTWEKKMKDKADMQRVKALQSEIRENLNDERQKAVERRKEQEERRKHNIAKNEIVQVIKKTEKIKKMNRKQLRQIKKMDVDKMVAKKV